MSNTQIPAANPPTRPARTPIALIDSYFAALGTVDALLANLIAATSPATTCPTPTRDDWASTLRSLRTDAWPASASGLLETAMTSTIVQLTGADRLTVALHHTCTWIAATHQIISDERWHSPAASVAEGPNAFGDVDAIIARIDSDVTILDDHSRLVELFDTLEDRYRLAVALCIAFHGAVQVATHLGGGDAAVGLGHMLPDNL